MAEILALEWGRDMLRGIAAQVSPGSVRIQRLIEIPQPGDTAPEGWLASALTAAGIRATDVIVTLPRDSVVARRLELPDAPDDEFPALVRFQAAAKSSIPLDDLYLDYLPLPKQEGIPTREVLLATVARSTVEEIRTLLTTAGLQLVSLRPGLVGAAELAARAGAADSPETAELIVARQGESCVIAISRQRSLVFAHAARLDADTVEQRNQILLAETSRALISLRATTSNLKIGHVWLLGTEADYPGLSDLLQQRVDAPVQTFDAWKLVQTDSRATPPAESRADYALLLGTLLSYSQPQVPTVDFLAPRKAAPKPDRRRRQLVMAAAGVGALILIGTASYWLRLSSLDGQIATRRQTEAKLTKALKEGEPVLKSASAIEEWQAGNVVWLDEMLEVSSLMPPTDRIYLTHWRFDPPARDQPARIKADGYARERDDVITLKGKLLAEESRYKLQPQGIRAATKDTYYPWQFEAELDVTPLASLKPDGKAAPEKKKSPVLASAAAAEAKSPAAPAEKTAPQSATPNTKSLPAEAPPAATPATAVPPGATPEKAAPIPAGTPAGTAPASEAFSNPSPKPAPAASTGDTAPPATTTPASNTPAPAESAPAPAADSPAPSAAAAPLPDQDE